MSSDAARRARRRRRNGWIAAASLMVVAGVVASDVAAHVVSGNDRQSDRQAFTSSSVEIASTLRLALQHEEDLVVSARGFIVGNPNASQGAFRRWTTAVDARRPLPPSSKAAARS